MKKKVVYLTQWMARDSNKEYPHGWGFEPPIIEFPQDKDPVEVANICREELSNEEFQCINVIPKELIDGTFEILGIMPGPEPDSEEWALRDIDLLIDDANFGNDEKIKQIEKVLEKYFSQKSH